MTTVPQESGLSLLSRLVVRPSAASCLGPQLPPLAPGCTTLAWGGDRDGKDSIKDKAGQNQDSKDSVHQPKDSVSPLLSYTLEVVCRLLLPGRVVEGGCGAGLVLVDCCHTLHTNTIASRLQHLVSGDAGKYLLVHRKYLSGEVRGGGGVPRHEGGGGGQGGEGAEEAHLQQAVGHRQVVVSIIKIVMTIMTHAQVGPVQTPHLVCVHGQQPGGDAALAAGPRDGEHRHLRHHHPRHQLLLPPGQPGAISLAATVLQADKGLRKVYHGSLW